MHCFQTLGATTRVSRIITGLRGKECYLPQAAICDWMESGGIAIEDVLEADYETLKTQVAGLLDREARARLRRAA